MGITQINSADFNYAMMLASINASYKGKADITISEYDTTAAPDVLIGSVFDDNGAILQVDTADETPTGYAGISVSTTFYLYYDEDPGAFIYSETVPTWSDDLQGWYNANDRAFFSMYKDSGGTLYENKAVLIHKTKEQIESFSIINIIDTLKYRRRLITSDNYIHNTSASINRGDVYDKVSPFMPDVGDIMEVNGGFNDILSSTHGIAAFFERTDASTIVLRGKEEGVNVLANITLTNGDANTITASLVW